MKLKRNDKKTYNNIKKYLNWNVEETMRKISNAGRRDDVIWGDKTYLEKTKIPENKLFDQIDADFINRLVLINNLFTKKDSTNALSMYSTTVDRNWESDLNSQLMETNIFDKALFGLKGRDGYYYLQWASKDMLIHKIQQQILDFNKNIF